MDAIEKAVLGSVRLDSDVWDAVRGMGCSLNVYLRDALLNEKPRKVSKAARVVAERAASDVTAQSVGREDIDYSDVESTPMTHVTTLDAVGPAVSSGQGKASIERWRASRKPLLKPGDRK